MAFLARDPMLNKLHADPRFQSLVQRIGTYGHIFQLSLEVSVGIGAAAASFNRVAESTGIL
jgi:hypothetical protein